MSWFWFLIAVTAAAAPCAPTFVFSGQPACVSVTWVDGRTRVENHCDGVLLLDRSVAGEAFRPVAPGQTVEVRDLSAFTLGLDGKLYRAVAALAQTCPVDAPSDEAAESQRQSRSMIP